LNHYCIASILHWIKFASEYPMLTHETVFIFVECSFEPGLDEFSPDDRCPSNFGKLLKWCRSDSKANYRAIPVEPFLRRSMCVADEERWSRWSANVPSHRVDGHDDSAFLSESREGEVCIGPDRWSLWRGLQRSFRARSISASSSTPRELRNDQRDTLSGFFPDSQDREID